MATIVQPFYGQRRRPILNVPVRIGHNPPIRERFILDTGSDFTIPSKYCWSRLRKVPEITGLNPKPIAGIGGSGSGIPAGPAVFVLETDEGVKRLDLDVVYLNQDDAISYSLFGHDFFRQYKAVLTFDFVNDEARMAFAESE